jgi:hypothetical protein
MSWTITRIDHGAEGCNTADIDRLQGALEKAAKKGILLFCSAPDSGAVSKSEFSSFFPVGCPTISKGIFKIGAAKADGKPWGWTGNERNIDFILPGHEVRERENDPIVLTENNPKTGSSIATALAAGLAALIIHCVRLGAIHSHRNKTDRQDANAMTDESLKSIKAFQNMKKVFSDMAKEQDGEKFVDVWESFHDVGKKFEGIKEQAESPEVSDDKEKLADLENQKWNIIARLARDFVSSKQIGGDGRVPQTATA